MSKSYELIYTSAPSGLRPGSRGFCTVAMSENMPAGLVGPIENLSAYRNVEGTAGPPVNFMHVQTKVAGRTVNVLSRVGPAPADYTGRTNKLAHHVVVDVADRTSGGPAAVLRQSDFSITSWDGEVHKIAEPKRIPTVKSPLRVASTWADLSGDAGWAGYLATVLTGRAAGPPTYLLYLPEQNKSLLELIDEAICLLPEKHRWDATFSTYAGELAPGVTCRLRCVIAKSPEADSLPPTASLIDLSGGQIGSPPPGPYVDAARTGEITQVPSENNSDTPVSVRDHTNDGDAVPAFLSTDVVSEFSPLNSAPPSLPPHAPLPPPVPSGTKQRSTKLAIAAAIAAVIMMGVVAGTAIYSARRDSTGILAELNQAAGIVDQQEDGVEESRLDDEPAKADQQALLETVSPIDQEQQREVARLEQKEEQKKETIKKLQELASKVRKGNAFLADHGDRSFSKFDKDVQAELQLLSKQREDLENISLDPQPEQLNQWVRSPSRSKLLMKFIDKKKESIRDSIVHKPTDELENGRQKRLSYYKSWDRLAKEWQHHKEEFSDLALEIEGSFKVDQLIKNVRSAKLKYLGDEVESKLVLHKRESDKIKEVENSLKKQIKQKEEEIESYLKSRRDAHRLAIYFDGVKERTNDKLQIKPRCLITIDDKQFASINRVQIDSKKPIAFSSGASEISLTGRLEGWVKVFRTDDGFALSILPKAIPEPVTREHRLLELLKVLTEEQEKAISGSEQPLRNLLRPKQEQLELRLQHKLQQAKEAVELKRKTLNEVKNDDEVEQLNQEIAGWSTAKEFLPKFCSDQLEKLETLDDVYIRSADSNITNLKAIKSVLRINNFKPRPPGAQLSPAEQWIENYETIEAKIDAYVTDLDQLKKIYNELKKNRDVVEIGGQIVFGSVSSAEIGQTSFTPLKTFELFFIPELKFGAPPK